ncbi:hypothetical protein ACHAXT_007283 [Thalassiosira profunda]
MMMAAFVTAAAIYLQLDLRTSAFGTSPPIDAKLGSLQLLNAGGKDFDGDVSDDAPSPWRRHLVSTAMGTLTTAPLLSGLALNPQSCSCCQCRLYNNLLLPPAANALVEMTPPPSDLEKTYDRPRNSGFDRVFSYVMSTDMDRYDAEARPYKSGLFKNLFDSLARNGGSDTVPSMVEIGGGTLPNAPYYAQAVADGKVKGLDIISVDPNDSMFGYAQQIAESSGLLSSSLDTSLRSVHGVAEALPFADGSIDACVGTLTLCSVSSQERALSEIQRVLKPGTGKFLFWEHVLSDDPGIALQQKILSPLQTLVADGCHLDRRTGESIQNAGFRGGVEMGYVRLDIPSFLSNTVLGIASC